MIFAHSDQFFASLAQDRPHFLIIRGQDDFAKEEAKERLFAHFSGYRVEKIEELAILGASLMGFSLFSEKKLFFVSLPDAPKEKECLQLQSFLKRPDPNYVVVLQYEGIKALALLDAEACILQLEKPVPWEKDGRIAAWIQGYLKKAGYSIQQSQALRLAKASQGRYALLVKELQKLCTYLVHGGSIRDEDIDAICTMDQEKSLWQLTDALLTGEISEAFRTLASLQKAEVHSFVTIRHIRNMLHQALEIASLVQCGQPRSVISERFSQLKGKLFEKAYTTATRLGTKRLEKALILVDKTQNMLKDSFADDVLIVETTVVKVKHALFTS